MIIIVYLVFELIMMKYIIRWMVSCTLGERSSIKKGLTTTCMRVTNLSSSN